MEGLALQSCGQEAGVYAPRSSAALSPDEGLSPVTPGRGSTTGGNGTQPCAPELALGYKQSHFSWEVLPLLFSGTGNVVQNGILLSFPFGEILRQHVSGAWDS